MPVVHNVRTEAGESGYGSAACEALVDVDEAIGEVHPEETVQPGHGGASGGVSLDYLHESWNVFMRLRFA